MFPDVEKYLEEPYRRQVGRNMKLCRKTSRPLITQEKMADILHVERQHIMRIENGKIAVTVSELMAYSTIFQIAPIHLLQGPEKTITDYIKMKNELRLMEEKSQIKRKGNISSK